MLVPVEKCVIDQDIRMEIIAAGQFGDRMLLYISIQDLSGLDRLEENTWLQLDYFAIGVFHPEQFPKHLRNRVKKQLK